MVAHEVNFDGLVGPTHNYGGLSYGNLASASHGQQCSNPRDAALQGLAKMKALMDRGLIQGILPPHERPALTALRQLGFSGSDQQVIIRAAREAMPLLVACSSASAMWAANAATVSPSADTADQRVHFTPANLNSKFHRSLEPATTGALLQAMFNNPTHFAHHQPLPTTATFGDEGAANHTRLCASYGQPGVEFFVFGRSAWDHRLPAPSRYPARQTREACDALIRLHGLASDGVVVAQQNPAVIDAGVFHNDVIAVGNGELLFHHQDAFVDSAQVVAELATKLAARGGNLKVIEVPRAAVAVTEAISSYLFNSQLLNRNDGRMVLVVPEECRQSPAVWAYLQQLLASNSLIAEVAVFDLKQSMHNGGGPACLRLRVVLNETELAAVNPGVILNNDRYQILVDWVKRHYRDRLQERDLADPQLLLESRTALDELTGLLQLGSVYPFQQP